MKRIGLPEMIWQDTLYALRTMRKEPVFAATAILTLALAIGGNTAMFTVVHAVLLKPLPYPDSDRLVGIGGATPSRFTEMKAAARSFTGIGAFTGEENSTLSGGSEPEVLKTVHVSANFLQILGVNPLLGRSFHANEDSPGGPPVVMISDALWQQRFAGDPEIGGKTATIAEAPYTIIGILPPGFSFPSPDVDVWMTAPSEWPLMPAKSRALSPFLNLFGRLKPGVSLEQATAEAKVIHRQYALAHPAMLDAKPIRPVTVTPMKDNLVANVRSMLWMLLGAVGFVLLIACANVASLLLARAASRSREIAVRSAVGAARIRLIAQFISESVVLSLCGGLLGVLFASWSLRAIPSITAFNLPRAQEVHLDWTVFAFAAAISIAAGVLFGLAPALGASRPDLIRLLRTSGEAAHQGAPQGIFAGLNVRELLLVAQVALSIVLLIGTALLIESVSRLRGVSIGFDPANVLTASVSLPPSRYDTNQKKAQFFQELVRRLDASPGIRSASASMFLPMMGYAGTPVQDAAKPLLKLNERPLATFSVVTPGYFRTLEIPLRRGRDFTERDKEGAQRVAIIDEALARRFWPAYPRGLDPISQYIWVGGINPNPAEIVGIVAHVHQNLENNVWPETVYVSVAQNPQAFATLAVRTEANPLGFTGSLREQVQALDKDQSISAVRTMDDLVDRQVGQRRLLAILLGSFAAMALLLVLMGIYGIIAYSVAQRMQEMGIRRALGAQPSDILRLVVGQSLRLALAGIGLGIAGAFGLTRLMQSLLFHVSPTDLTTFASVALLFLLVALAASYIPARRAIRIDPIAALRVL
ncbi:MAG TPA: ABC transporter permease [Bryobacteraceae bacterium]|nr:ABC transporter permease [Bryobacteraceae bacterium]